VAKPKHKRPSRHAARLMRRKAKPGVPAGTVHSHAEAVPTVVRLVSYSADQLDEHVIHDAAGIREHLPNDRVTWIDVQGLGDANMVTELGKLFGLHPLALEDVVNTHQRPKLEAYDDHLFLIVRTVTPNEHLGSEQIGIFLTNNVVLTFREKPSSLFEPVLEHLRQAPGRLRQGGAARLFHAILDAVIDVFFPILETCGQRLDDLDAEVATRPREVTLVGIHELKGDLLVLRRAVWPLRDAIGELLREDSALLDPDTRLFLRDCHDHAVQIIDLVQTCHELCADTRDFYLTQINNRLNEIMKVLTVIATIFMPLTFIAGVYGMNFDLTDSPWNMPELHCRWGYPAVLGVMVTVAVSMIFFFRRRGWLEW
jgi:magnesium transporter